MENNGGHQPEESLDKENPPGQNKSCQCKFCQVIYPALQSIKDKVSTEEYMVINELYNRAEVAETDKAMLKLKIEEDEITDIKDCLLYLK